MADKRPTLAKLQRAAEEKARLTRELAEIDAERARCADGSTANLSGVKAALDRDGNVCLRHADDSLARRSFELTTSQALALAGWLARHVGSTGKGTIQDEPEAQAEAAPAVSTIDKDATDGAAAPA